MTSYFKRFTIPHVFIFLSAIILFSSILTYVVPSGTYQRQTKRIGNMEQNVVIPGSYRGLPKQFSVKGIILGEHVEGKASPVSILGLFTSIPKGMNQAGSLIFFVFIIGAVFNLIRHTGTINVVMFFLLEKFQKKPFILFLVIYTFIFAASSFMGMGAEFIPLIPLFLLIAKETGNDRIFGIALFVLPMSIGWTTALTNPFNVQIAQKIAEVPIGSGMGLRIVLFVITHILGFAYLMRYSKRIKKDKSLSLMQNDPFNLEDSDNLTRQSLEKKHILIMVIGAILFSMILYAVQTMGWGLIEMSGGFFMVGLCTILISGMSGKESMKAFVQGLEAMIVPALIIGFARGIQVVMIEGQIVDTLLYQTALILEKLPLIASVEGMLFFQSILNFFIPSASGQALVSMPLMVPLSDLLQISRQTTVLTYVMGDGFSNIIIPTSGILMAVLGIAAVPYEKWFRFVLRLFLLLMTVAIIILIVAVLSGY